MIDKETVDRKATSHSADDGARAINGSAESKQIARGLPAGALLIEALRPQSLSTLRCMRALVQDEAMDWNLFVRQVQRHGVVGLVHECLRASETYPEGESGVGGQVAIGVPRQVMDTLKVRRQHTMWNNMSRMEEFMALLDVLESAKIPVIPFKGPVLAHRYYEDLAFRQYGDLDLLVHRSDIQRVKAVLQDRGYVPLRDLTAKEEEAFIDSQMAYEFVHEEKRVIVEVHWSLLHAIHGVRLSPETIWQNSRTMHMGGRPIRAFAPSDLIVYLTAHGTKHGWYRLLWVCDLDRIVRRHRDINWSDALDQARSAGCARALRLGLYVCNRWLGTPLPSPLTDTIAGDDELPEMVAYVEERWLFADIRPKDDTVAARAAFLSRTRERPQDRWAYYKHLIGLALTPTKKDRSVVNLSPKLSFLYYAIRPFRLVRDWLLKVQ